MKRMDAEVIKAAEIKLNTALAILPDDLDVFTVELGHRYTDDVDMIFPTVSIHSMKPVNLPGFRVELVPIGENAVHAHLHIDEDTEIWWACHD